MKKTTMQMVADKAGVSRITVWKVINNQSGVSDLTRNHILETLAQLNYPVSPKVLSSAEPSSKNNHFAISVVVSRPESSSLWTNIIHEIAKEASKHNYSLLYTYVPTDINEDYILPAQLKSGSIHGMIILNVYSSTLLSMLNQINLPKVFLDIVTDFSIDSLKGDLILLEGRSAVRQITDTLIKNGKEKIGFIGDINYALTNHLRYDGFVESMSNHNLPIVPEYCFICPIGIKTYLDEINSYLSSLTEMPEAFVCASDFMAHCVYQYLLLHDYTIPDQIALSGYDNEVDYAELNNIITTVNVDTTKLGKRLFYQLKYRIKHPETPYEIIYVRPNVIFRHSTD